MKINKNFTMREIAGEYILVPTGTAALEVNGLLMTNEVGAFIWQLCQEEISEDELVSRIVAEFEVEEETARTDAGEFLNRLRELQIL